jgi:hypothetical protein
MIVLENNAPAAPLDLSTLIKRQKLSAADRTALTSTCRRIAKSLDLIEANRPSKTGFYSRLQAAADVAEREVMDDPTPANVERLHVAVTRVSQAAVSFPRINPALNAAIRREIDGLAPLANRLLDSTAKALADEGSKRLREITQADSVFGEAGDSAEFQRRLDSTRVSLSDERSAVNQGGAALDWLCRHGFTENPFRDAAAFLVDDAEPLDLDRELQADLH